LRAYKTVIEIIIMLLMHAIATGARTGRTKDISFIGYKLLEEKNISPTFVVHSADGIHIGVGCTVSTLAQSAGLICLELRQ
jgi:hypothetical protein